MENVTFRISSAFTGRMSSWWPHGRGGGPTCCLHFRGVLAQVPTAAETGTGAPGPAVGGTPSVQAGMLGGRPREASRVCSVCDSARSAPGGKSPRPQLRSGRQVRGGPGRGQELGAVCPWRGPAVLGHAGRRPSALGVPAAHHACAPAQEPPHLAPHTRVSAGSPGGSEDLDAGRG